MKEKGPDVATEASVAMPWRPQSQRQAAYEYCRKWWEDHGFEVFTSPGDPNQIFSLAEARNWAVHRTQMEPVLGGVSRPAEVVILADADTVGDIEVIRQGIEVASEDGYVVYPFDEYRYISAGLLPALTDGIAGEVLNVDELMCKWAKKDSVGGLLITKATTYWDLGGMDERFTRTWGFEDNAFVAAADTLANVVRLKGTVYSFSHDDDTQLRDWSPRNPNYWRNELYSMCYGKPRLMAELIK